MKRTTLAIAFAAALTATTAAAAPGRGKLELGASLGAHLFAPDVELGVIDAPGAVARPESSALFSARLGWSLSARLALEGELALVPTTDDVMGEGAMVFGFRAQALFHLTRGRVRPFLVAGLGGLGVLGTGRDDAMLADDADLVPHWGAGLTFDLTPRLGLRLDARQLIVPNTGEGELSADYEVAAGVVYRFGGAKQQAPKKQVVARTAPRPRDGDKDRLVDDRDDCPLEAEDFDSFQDADGCPEPDNDGDGLADPLDDCTLDAETPNGYQDDDGCPDVPRFEGAIEGITFARGSAEIDRSSAPALDAAAEALLAYPTLRIEIAGHTSSEGDREENLALSLARAEAVKAYLVARGVSADRIETVGHGPDLPIADNDTADGRARNRRIEFRILRK